MILAREWINIIKPKIVKDILKTRRLLKVEYMRRKAVGGRLIPYFVNFINSKSDHEDLSILGIA